MSQHVQGNKGVRTQMQENGSLLQKIITQSINPQG